MRTDTRSALLIGAVAVPLVILLFFGEGIGDFVSDFSTGAVGFLLEAWLAPAISAAMLAIAILLAVVYGFAYWRPIAIRLNEVRARFETETPRSFSTGHAMILERTRGDPLIGRPFAEFSETLLHPSQPGGEIGNTIRPSAFITYGVLRNGSLGLRLAPSLPGYFVGFGLLFTFAGLLAALSATSSSVGSPDVAEAQAGLGALLTAATFKFSTSIAGLFASILLSFYFRLMTASLEKNVDALCRAIEKPLVYTPPQRLQERQNDLLDLQLAETRKLNAEVLPAIAAVGAQFETALRPIGETLARTASSSAAIEISLADLKARVGLIPAALQPISETLAKDAASNAAIEVSLADLRARMGTFSAALGHLEKAIGEQALALQATAEKTGDAADVFDKAVGEVQNAVAPFEQVSTNVIAASDRMVAAYDEIAGRTALTHDEARRVVEQIGVHLHSLETIWQSYRDRFESVDSQLAATFRGMVEQVRLNQSQAADFLVKLDRSFAEAMTTLSLTLDQVRDRTEDLSQSVAALAKSLPQAAE